MVHPCDPAVARVWLARRQEMTDVLKEDVHSPLTLQLNDITTGKEQLLFSFYFSSVVLTFLTFCLPLVSLPLVLFLK